MNKIRPVISPANSEMWESMKSMYEKVKQVERSRQNWSRAFMSELGVSENFYFNASPERKAWLEAHYTELATHDTPKGRRAAKVIATRVRLELQDEEPDSDFPHIDAMMEKALRGKSLAQTKITGRTAHAVILDDPLREL